jgi:hypothetical protein
MIFVGVLITLGFRLGIPAKAGGDNVQTISEKAPD